MPHSNAWVITALGVTAGIAVHSVALSAFEIGKTWASKLVPGMGNEITSGVILGAGCLMGLLAFWGASWARGRLQGRMRERGDSQISGFLNTALELRSPGKLEGLWMVLIGALGITFLCAMHAVAHEVWHFIHALGDGWIVGLGMVATLGIAAYWRLLERPETAVRQGEPGRTEALILFLSSAEGTEVEFGKNLLALRMPLYKATVRKALGMHRWAIPTRSISRAWEQGALAHVVVIGSTGKGATWPAFEAFRDGILPTFEDSPPEFYLLPKKVGVDFNSFAELQSVLIDAYALLNAKGATRITVDVTSGTKICTVAGLVEALEPGRAACYVTNDLDVKAYDFEHRAPGLSALPHEGI